MDDWPAAATQDLRADPLAKELATVFVKCRIEPMTTWYYTKNGERLGPVSFEEIKTIARSGSLDVNRDLAWTEGMQEWKPLSAIPGLLSDGDAPSNAPFNPYGAPSTASDDLLAPSTEGPLTEITPGSLGLPVMTVIKRAIAIVKRQFGTILAIGIVYLVISWGINLVLGAVDGALGLGRMTQMRLPGGEMLEVPSQSILAQIVGFVCNTFLLLGLTRASLDLASGEPASISSLFSQGHKLLKGLGALLLVYLIVALGFLALILPGIFLAARLSYINYAIVDLNLGVIDSIKYSYKLTEKNVLNNIGLYLMGMLILLLGVIALVVGLVFAIPVLMMAMPIAFRFLQYGNIALQDHPGTEAPMLQGRTNLANR